MTSFNDLGLDERVLKAVAAEGYEIPTPIQAQAIPYLLESRDLLGIAQTGTGKTAAFTLPTLHHLLAEPKRLTPKAPRVLVLSPTRELALQIAASFRTYAQGMRCSVETVFGGVKITQQIRVLKRGTDVLVATPGRLCDLLNQGAVRLDEVEHLILDEADQMLDLGFVHDLKKIVAKVPDKRQTLLFSATMPKQIAQLAEQFLFDPVRVSIAPESTTAERVEQGVLHVAKEKKPRVLTALLTGQGIDRVLIFTRTKHGADRVVTKLDQDGIEAKAIHGNKSQPQRVRALNAFREGRCKVLVATDIAARGIDIDGVSHVINYEMPNVAEQYVHRIGRTARAGREGLAISLVAEDELYYLREVEKVTRASVPVLEAPEGCEDILLPTPDPKARVIKPKGPGQQNRRPPQNSRGGRPTHKGQAGGQAKEKSAGSARPRGKRRGARANSV